MVGVGAAAPAIADKVADAGLPEDKKKAESMVDLCLAIAGGGAKDGGDATEGDDDDDTPVAGKPSMRSSKLKAKPAASSAKVKASPKPAAKE